MAVRILLVIATLGMLACSDDRPRPPVTRDYAPPTPNVAEADRVPLDRAAAGQLVYVPIYSHVYHLGGQPYSLEATLSVRNTDPAFSITINRVDYFDSAGELVQAYLERPLSLGPLESTSFVVATRDVEGGVGANFLVEWVAERSVHEPMLEAIMIGKIGTHGVSFARSGRVLVDRN